MKIFWNPCKLECEVIPDLKKKNQHKAKKIRFFDIPSRFVKN